MARRPVLGDAGSQLTQDEAETWVEDSMGYLDNLAIRRTEKKLRPFMRADERLIEYDICNVDPLGPKVPVVLSSRAIYLMPRGGTAVRTPYENVIDLRGMGASTGVATSSGNSFILHPIGSPKGDVYETIAHHLDALMLHSETVEVPGGDVLCRCRPVKEDGEPTWLYCTGEGVDLQDPAVDAAVRDALGTVAERLGVPPPTTRGGG